MNQDAEIPPWVGEDAVNWIRQIDSRAQRLTLEHPPGADVATFGDVPAGWHITIDTSRTSGPLDIRLTRQAAGVGWEFRGVRSNVITLPKALRNVSIVPQDGTRPTTVIALAKILAVKLAPGTYSLTVGPNGAGDYSVREIPATQNNASFVFNGPAQLRRFRGSAARGLTVHNPVADVDYRDLLGPVTFLATPNGATLSTQGSVIFKAGARGLLDVTAARIAADEINARGLIRANDIRIEDRIMPEVGRLSAEATGFMWCRKGFQDTDVLLRQPPQGVSLLLVGMESPNSRIAIDYGPIGNIHEARRSVVSAPDRTVDASVNTSTVRGDGDFEMAGSAVATVVDLTRSFTCAGSFSAHQPPEGGPVLKAARAIIGGTLNMAESRALVVERLDAAAIGDGHVCDASGHLVVMTDALRGAHVSASTVRVTAESSEDTALSDSHVVGTHHLHVVGGIDSTSTLEGHGDMSIAGDCDAETPVLWVPGTPWQGVQAKQLSIRGVTRHLSAVGSSAALPLPRVVIADGGKVEYLDASGQLSVNFHHTDGTPLLTRLRLSDKSHIVVDGFVSELPLVETAGRVRLTAQIDEATVEVSLGLAAAAESDQVDLDAGGGLLRVVAPCYPPGDDSGRAAVPRVVAVGGDIGVDVTLAALTCLPDDPAHVVGLDVGARGRVNELSGEFGLRHLAGRLHGVTRDDHGTTPARLRDLRGEQFVNPEQAGQPARRRGQLIDVDISRLPSSDVPGLTALQVLSPSPSPLIKFASALGPHGHGGLAAYRAVLSQKPEPSCDDDVRAEAQRLREIADIVRSRANSGSTYSAAQWAAAHAHALQVKWLSFERPLRWLHRWVGYGVRPGPALATYAAWTLLVAIGLFLRDADPGELAASPDFRPGTYGFLDSLGRAFLLPAGVLRSDVGGATPYRPAFENPVWHFVLVVVTGVVVGFLAVALKNFLLRPKSDS